MDSRKRNSQIGEYTELKVNSEEGEKERDSSDRAESEELTTKIQHTWTHYLIRQFLNVL
jgi:hypothetical protein